MIVDKTSSPKNKPGRSAGRSPAKQDGRTNPHATPAKADQFKYAGSFKPAQFTGAAQIENATKPTGVFQR